MSSILQVKPDVVSYSSDYFDKYLEMAEQLIKEGVAYVDDTPPDKMKTDREARIKSPCRDNCENGGDVMSIFSTVYI